MKDEEITEESVAAKLQEMGLPILPEEVGPLTVGVRRVFELAAANREVVTDAMAPVLLVRPARRPGRGS